MGLFNKVMAKQDSDIEEFLNTIDEEPEENYEDADAFVKPMDLISEADLKTYGADYYFVKPLEVDKLRQALRTCLSKERRL